MALSLSQASVRLRRRVLGLLAMLKHFLVPEADQVLVSEAAARAGMQALFERMGMAAEDAALCADVLVTSDLRGCESHGISNMVRRYLAMYADGTLNATPTVRTLHESPVGATWDADRGIGLQVGPRAMRAAMEKAAEFGMGAVGVQNCGHVGMLAYYPLMAIAEDMIGVCMVSAGGGIMVPTFGSEPAFGTHPIAWAAPAGDRPPFVFDVATTQVAANKLGLAKRIGSHLEPGWIADLDGRPILDSVPVPDFGKFHMLPFGGTRENGSHKGYGFALVADVMSGILSGNGPGFVASGARTSQFVMAFKVSAFTDLPRFKTDMDALLGKLATMKPAPGCERVYYAGLIEHEEAERRRANGIPYHREVVDWFNGASAELNLALRWP